MSAEGLQNTEQQLLHSTAGHMFLGNRGCALCGIDAMAAPRQVQRMLVCGCSA